jgi:hypothetical protein
MVTLRLRHSPKVSALCTHGITFRTKTQGIIRLSFSFVSLGVLLETAHSLSAGASFRAKNLAFALNDGKLDMPARESLGGRSP